MPYEVKKQGEEWCVFKEGEADSLGCHDNEDAANEQVQALYAEEKAVEELPADAEEDMPADEAPEADSEDEAPAEEAEVNVPSTIKRVVLNIVDATAKALGRKSDEGTGMKVAGNAWVIVWSNNFKDRDGEIFTAKAIDEYIARVDMGVVPLPELWVWHTPGTRIGQADWVDRHGHFVLAGGEFDDTPDGRSAKAYYSKHAHEKGISHGFKYPVEHFDGKHYENFNTFEFTPLPLGAEANLYTSFEGVKEAKMHEKKKAELIAVFGEKRAEEILANLDARGKALEELNVEFKDFVKPDASESADAKALDAADKAFKDLFPELVEGSGEAVTAALEAAKRVKAVEDKQAEVLKAVDELRAEMRLRPRIASKSEDTVMSNDELLEKVKQQFTERDPFTGLEVERTP